VTPALASVIARQPGVRAVTEIRLTHATIAGGDRSVNGVDPATIGQFTDLGVTAGSVAALSQPGTIMVSGTGFRLGQRLRVQFGAYGTYSLRVVAKFTEPAPLNAYLISNSTMAADSGVRADELDLVRAAGRARGPIKAALAQYPGATLLDHAGFIASESSKLDTLLNLVRALLILAIVIALLGVVNTLVLSISERTREIGLMRAIGMYRGQLRQIVAAESMIISAIGALLGVILGVGLGAALAAALTKSEQLTVAIPVGQLIVYVVATAAVGVLASIGPARRAARLDMLTAIAAE
jgi:putative ABC transport system permease protein